METLTDIRKAEQDKIARARTFERLTNEALTLRSQVEGLKGSPADVTALETIITLTDQVPSSITTRGSGFVPGGFVAKDVLFRTASDALAEAKRRDRERHEHFKKAKARLIEVERELKDYE